MQNQKTKKNYVGFTLATTLTTAAVFSIVAACTDTQAKAKPNFVTKDAPRAGVVAKIGGEEITEDQLIGDDKLDFFELKKREYDLRMDRLNRLVLDKLVGSEAKKAGMNLDQYIDQKIAKGAPKISDSEYKKFVADKRIPESQITPDIKNRIMTYMQSQKKQDLVQEYVAKLTKSNPVEVYFKRPKMEMKVEAGNAPFAGGANAPVTIVEFSDFQCPFCARAADTVTQLKKKYGSKIKVAFKQFPLPMHQQARPASEAALCVNEQGTDKFWKFHDLAFKEQDKLDNAGLEAKAKSAGANVEKFKQCYGSGKFKQAVQEDMDYGEKLGVKSTPTFFVNGELVSGAVPIEQFSEIIDAAIAEKK